MDSGDTPTRKLSSRPPALRTRTLIVGDVHGCADELEDLLASVTFRPEVDELVLAGDLVRKGPYSVRVVEIADRLAARVVRGNHDEKALSEGALPSPTLGYLAAQPLFHRLPNLVTDVAGDGPFAAVLAPFAEAVATARSARGVAFDMLVVHAGFDPMVPLHLQSQKAMQNMRSIRPDGSVSKVMEEGVPWASRWPGPDLVCFGHDAVRKLQVHRFALGLDTGCVYGGHLTGALVEQGRLRLVQVKARRQYTPID